MTLKSNQIILSGMKKEQSSVAPEYNNYSSFHYQKCKIREKISVE